MRLGKMLMAFNPWTKWWFRLENWIRKAKYSFLNLNYLFWIITLIKCFYTPIYFMLYLCGLKDNLSEVFPWVIQIQVSTDTKINYKSELENRV